MKKPLDIYLSVGTSRRLLCGLIILLVSPISFLAHSQSITGLERRGWKITGSNSTDTYLHLVDISQPPTSRTPPQLSYRAPGRGVPASQIEGVYHHPNWMYMLNMGSSDFGEDWVLFKNGEAWRGPRLPPQDVDVAKAKAAEPKNWGRWMRSGNNIAVCMSYNDNVCVNQQMIFFGPAPRAQHLEGSWSSSSGFVSDVYHNSTSAVVTNTLALHANGRFERTGFAGASFQGRVGKTTTGGTFPNKAPAISGRYHIAGYSLELTYDDGRVERDLFYWVTPYKMLMLNGLAYLGGTKR